MAKTRPLLFALEGSQALGTRVAEELGWPLAPVEERPFECGEHKARSRTDVEGRDVYVLHGLHGDASASANDKLMRLLLFLAAVKDNGAARATAVLPYLCYARKDRRTKPRDPVNTRTLARLFESVGTDRVLVLDVHNPAAFENAFRIRADELTATPLFVAHFATRLGGEKACVLSPDSGGMKRAERFRRALERALDRQVTPAVMEKHRSAGLVRGNLFAGEVDGRTVIVIDDLTESGGTLVRAAEAAKEAGAARVLAAVTHAPELPRDAAILQTPALEEIVVTDSVGQIRRERGTLTVLPIARLFADAIRTMSVNGDLTDLDTAPVAEEP